MNIRLYNRLDSIITNRLNNRISVVCIDMYRYVLLLVSRLLFGLLLSWSSPARKARFSPP
nr:MAG TPA: hypothetical protein [Crassvirales sp.]